MIREHHDYMREALSLAEGGRFSVSPNPMVGCLIVKEGRVVGSGYHLYAGGPHAEVYAVQQAGHEAQGATVYLTLEPCCHFGKTPPCAPLLIKAGVKKVYVACLDPNPLVQGRGVEALRAAGIAVEVGLGEQAAKEQNEIFFYYMQRKLPFVIAKWAMSLDGKTITHPEDNRQISGSEATLHTHQLRQQVDAILIGANTAREDNPLLTARVAGNDHVKQPMRIILTATHALPLDLRVFTQQSDSKTWLVVTNKKHISHYESLIKTHHHIELLLVSNDNQHQVCLPTLLQELANRGITSILVEGGRKVHESFFNENLVNKVHVYLSPIIIGAQKQKHRLQAMISCQLGKDVFITATY